MSNTKESTVTKNPNDILEQALGLLGYREDLPSHYRSNLLRAIQQYAGLSRNEGLEYTCEARLNLIRAENEATQPTVSFFRSTTSELQDPIAVINTMQVRIDQLERQQQIEREAAQNQYELVVHDSVRRLRLHGVIPLYVGADDFDKVRSDVRRSSPLLVSAIEEAWLLQNAPVADAAKSALLAAANHGMNRW